MFSGIIETLGIIMHIENKQGCKYFTIKPAVNFTDFIIGESISVNGVCLTVTDFTYDFFTVSAVPETLRLTNLNQLDRNSAINLERALKLSDRLGGHFVQGHIDTMGEILELQHDDSNALLVKISITPLLAKYVINKGFITIDGMSITVIESTPEWFSVTFIPHTQDVTIIKQYQKGSFVNIEVDMMGKYIEKLLGAHACNLQ